MLARLLAFVLANEHRLSNPSVSLDERKFHVDIAQRRLENAREDAKLGIFYLLKSSFAIAITPLIAALIAYFGGIQVGNLNAKATLKAQTLKNESDLIVEALSDKDQAVEIKALKFLAAAGMIDDYRTKVMALADKDKGRDIPTFSYSAPQIARPNQRVRHFYKLPGDADPIELDPGQTCEDVARELKQARGSDFPPPTCF